MEFDDPPEVGEPAGITVQPGKTHWQGDGVQAHHDIDVGFGGVDAAGRASTSDAKFFRIGGWTERQLQTTAHERQDGRQPGSKTVIQARSPVG